MKRTCRLIATLAALLTFGITSVTALATSPVFEVDHDFYPYYPSLIKWNKSSVPFNPPQNCSGCHQKQFKEWNGSVHSLAFKDPIYQGELNKGIKDVGHEVTRQCEGCHTPVGMITGDSKGPDASGLSDLVQSGVFCDVCHSVSGVTHWQTPSHEPENGSFILTPGKESRDGQNFIKRGPYKPDDQCGGGFHQCIESGLHQRADLCASCHQVYHYDGHFPLEAPYNEWKHGLYAQKSIHCQDCHMVDFFTFIRSADQFIKPERSEYRHFFNGANFLLDYLAAWAAGKADDKELAKNLINQYEMSVDRLKSAADLELSPIYREGKLVELKVQVKNIRAGHNLPTALSNVRQMWLEITAKDEDGKVIMTSGTLKADGSMPEDARIFNSEGMGNDFHFAIEPWVVTSFSHNETIPPRGYKDVYYGLQVPGKVKKVSVEVRLRFRQAWKKVAEDILAALPKDINLERVYGLKAVPALPIVDMVVKQSTMNTVME
jgi:hypothetical protein